MRVFSVVVFCFCFFASEAGVAGIKVKGGISRLINTVVDVIVSDKNDENSENKSLNGTGFIVTEDGYILTNCHVIDGAEKIKIVTVDGNEYIAKIIGKVDQYDIALLKIDVDPSIKLSYVQFADSDKVEVGDPVIAIGNPLELGKTVTSGIVSYKGRNLSNQIAELGANGDLVSYIQTDAYVNYGNSGGPLFSEEGKVVGMITVFMSDGLHSIGINFAIPSNLLNKVFNQLRKYGKIQRSWLGISLGKMDKNAAKFLLNSNVGYHVTHVSENSSAKAAGIKVGDIILEINEEPISETTNIDYLLNNLPIGAVIPIQVIGDDKKRRMLSITVGAYNDDVSSLMDEENNNEDIPCEKIDGLDLGLADLTPALREIFKIPTTEDGVLVSFVDSSLASKISVGTLIKKVNLHKIKNLTDLKYEIERSFSDKNISKQQIVLYIKNPITKVSNYIAIDCKKPKSFLKKNDGKSRLIAK